MLGVGLCTALMGVLGTVAGWFVGCVVFAIAQAAFAFAPDEPPYAWVGAMAVFGVVGMFVGAPVFAVVTWHWLSRRAAARA